MSIEDNIRAAMLNMLKDYFRCDDAVEVIDWDESVYYGGYCETCSYESVMITIQYRTKSGEVKKHEVESTFGELITRLAAYER